jgi:hypothetical protein
MVSVIGFRRFFGCNVTLGFVNKLYWYQL